MTFTSGCQVGALLVAVVVFVLFCFILQSLSLGTLDLILSLLSYWEPQAASGE